MSQGSSIRGVDVEAAGSTSTSITLCIVCGEPIPLKRLLAIRDAKECVSCLTAAGDVPLLKRLDEYTPDGDRVETMFTENALLQAHIKHMNSDVAGDAAFEVAAGETTETDPRETEQLSSVLEDIEASELDAPLDDENWEEIIDEICLNEEDESVLYQTRVDKIKAYYAAAA